MSDSFAFDLADSTELLSRVASALSHDVRTPLRHTSQFLEFYERELKQGNTEKAENYLMVVKESIAQTYSMIDGLIGYARAGLDLAPPETIDLKKLAQTAVDRVRLATNVPTIDFSFKGETRAVAHEAQLLDLFYQLFENSVLYRKPDTQPRIRVRSRKSDRGLVLTIQDNGPGLPEGYRNIVFDLFQKVSGPGATGGLGVGLALARRIAELHGGSLSIAEPTEDVDCRGFALELVLPAIEPGA